MTYYMGTQARSNRLSSLKSLSFHPSVSANFRLATDQSLPIRDANLDVHTALAAYARSLSVLGMSAKVDAVLPYSWLSGDATFAG